MPKLDRGRSSEGVDIDIATLEDLLKIFIKEQRITNVYLKAIYGEDIDDQIEEID